MKCVLKIYAIATNRPPQKVQTEPLPGHQSEFRSTLEDKLLEKIVMIWTLAKTLKKNHPNQSIRGGSEETPQKAQKALGHQNELGTLWKINSSGKSSSPYSRLESWSPPRQHFSKIICFYFVACVCYVETLKFVLRQTDVA